VSLGSHAWVLDNPTGRAAMTTPYLQSAFAGGSHCKSECMKNSMPHTLMLTQCGSSVVPSME
jgi:hypothetical protein